MRSRTYAVLVSLTATIALIAGTPNVAASPHSTVTNPAREPVNPYSPAHGHGYRHGVVPTRERHLKMKAWARRHAAVVGGAATGPNTLSYGGGVDGIGVTSGKEKVYLVFWGTQWGSQGTDASGNLTFSSDYYGGAPKLQMMFRGLGTGGELWSGTMTQYCDGPSVSTGAVSCPANAAFVGYPSGGALAGVWYDNSAAEPMFASAADLAQEAITAAGHFGNTTPAANRDAQYVILSASGENPDGFPFTGFCAWHDWNGDPAVGVTSPYGDIAFTNMPYVMDQGASCGMNFVNAGAAGYLDGYTMVEGHEYAETITDQNPAGGWTNHVPGSPTNGEENADECAWISSGQGAPGNITTGNGTFAMQSTWSNDTNRCDLTHPLVGGGGTANVVTVVNPGPRVGSVGTGSSLQIQASDSSASARLTYSATGLPAGLALNSSTGLISGTPSTAATYTVTIRVTDDTGSSGSASFTWTINPASGSCAAPGQKLVNPGFESGNVSWSASAGVIGQWATSGEPTRTGTWDAWLDGYGSSHTDTLTQSVPITAGCHAKLSFYLHIDTAERSTSAAYDTLIVKVGSTTLATFSNLNRASGYTLRSYDISSFAGQAVTVSFTGVEDASRQTSFVVDDTAITLT